MGNKTTVAAGAIASSLATVIWWGLGVYQPDISPPDAVVAASVGILTAILQFSIPSK